MEKFKLILKDQDGHVQRRTVESKSAATLVKIVDEIQQKEKLNCVRAYRLEKSKRIEKFKFSLTKTGKLTISEPMDIRSYSAPTTAPKANEKKAEKKPAEKKAEKKPAEKKAEKKPAEKKAEKKPAEKKAEPATSVKPASATVKEEKTKTEAVTTKPATDAKEEKKSLLAK